MLIVVATLILVPQKAVTKSIPESAFRRLGKWRASFGDKPNSGPWKFVGSNKGETIVIFPFGRADVRYYLTPIAGRLCCESKGGSRISLDWMIKISSGKVRAPDVKQGTLANLLRQWGWVTTDRMTASTQRSMRDRSGLVIYEYSQRAGNLTCSLYDLYEGVFHKPDPDFFSEDLYPQWPKTSAFPISKAERLAIKKQGIRLR